MIFTDFVYVFTGIGIFVGTLGAVFLCIFGVCVLYELLEDNWNNIRRENAWKKWKREDELFAVQHLNKLAEKYPELEITYKKH